MPAYQLENAGKFAAALSVLASVFLSFSTGANAYTLNGQDWTQNANPMGENWKVCTTNMPAGAASRIKEGAAKWNYSKFNFTFDADGCSSGGTYPNNNNVNQIDFRGGLDTVTLAETTWFYNTATKKISECDMRFDSGRNWYTGTATPESNQFDLLSVAIHEFGHCLSLGHSNVSGAVMSSSIGAGEAVRDLQADDLNGIRAIYGAP